MPTNTDFISVICSKIDMPKEDLDYILKKLFKYKDDPVVGEACNIIVANFAHIQTYMQSLRYASGTKPSSASSLVMVNPDNPLELRVYPNIILSDHTVEYFQTISTENCKSVLKDFLTNLDADREDPNRRQRWEPIERALKRLNEFQDMPTSTAIARHSGIPGLSSAQIRDISAKIDDYRKPMELLWAEKPADFVDMYTGGPNSCMSLTNAGEREMWDFMKKDNLCPTSMYAYYPHSKGVYAKKNGAVVCRAICFRDPAKDKWYWGRIYSSSSEYTNQFVNQLKKEGLAELPGGIHHSPSGLRYTMPGFRKGGSVYYAPYPYIDNMDRSHWYCKFDTEKKEFVISYQKQDLDMFPLNRKSGHITSTDYISMTCTNCGKKIAGAAVVEVRSDEDDIFCSEACANDNGYVTVIQGNSEKYYTKQTDNPNYCSTYGMDTVKFSNLNAAQSHGYSPVMEEVGITSEDGGYEVAVPDSMFRSNVRASGLVYLTLRNPQENDRTTQVNLNKIPFEVVKKKVVEFDDTNEPLMVEA